MNTLKKILHNSIGGWICLIVSIVLLVVGFLLPPTGIIDNSVIIGVGELFAWGVLFNLPKMINDIKEGKQVQIKHNNTEINIKDNED